MTRQELIEAVKIEASNLRKFATKEQLDNLTIKSFDPGLHTNCIYGLITGDCHGINGVKLIKKCAEKIITEKGIDCDIENSEFGDLDDLFKQGDRSRYFSPIEQYISQGIFNKIGYNLKHQNIQNKKLISYLRGETDELNLE